MVTILDGRAYGKLTGVRDWDDALYDLGEACGRIDELHYWLSRVKLPDKKRSAVKKVAPFIEELKRFLDENIDQVVIEIQKLQRPVPRSEQEITPPCATINVVMTQEPKE